MGKLKVGFVCGSNSGRSQMAEALGKHFAPNTFESYSAGTKEAPAINADALRLMKDVYDIDMAATQKPKTLDKLPELDIVITMGCNVNCPVLPCKHREDWGIGDLPDDDDAAFIDAMRTIEEKVKLLKTRVEDGEFE